MNNQTYTLTFSEAVENHAKMEIIGQKALRGFSNDFCRMVAKEHGGEIYNLATDPDKHPETIVVVFRDGLKTLMGLDHRDLFLEQEKLEKDSKAFMYGRVVNKKARHNLCFADIDREPDYENKKGTIVNFNGGRVPLLQQVRQDLYKLFGEECRDLYAEGNYYYDTTKCYIGFHGDSERKRVIGIRLGSQFPLHYRWFNRGQEQPIIQTINLNPGDIYIFSEKATGNDWKHRSIHNTIRHAAGNLSAIGCIRNSYVQVFPEPISNNLNITINIDFSK